MHLQVLQMYQGRVALSPPFKRSLSPFCSPTSAQGAMHPMFRQVPASSLLLRAFNITLR